MRYDFERLEVYQQAMNFTERIYELTESFPQHLQYSLGDQLRRAALSICNNLAEGSQKRGAAKRQFCGYALDSSRECVPMLQLCQRRHLIDETSCSQLTDLGFHVGNMLYRMLAKVV